VDIFTIFVGIFRDQIKQPARREAQSCESNSLIFFNFGQSHGILPFQAGTQPE